MALIQSLVNGFSKVDGKGLLDLEIHNRKDWRRSAKENPSVHHVQPSLTKLQVVWPEKFNPGVGRIKHLNRHLLVAYNRLAELINMRRKSEAVVKENKGRNLGQNVWSGLHEKLTDSKHQVKVFLPRVRCLIGELDAVGGKGCYLIPKQFAEDIGKSKDYLLCPTGELSSLLSDERYYCEDIAQDDESARSTSVLAYHMNRFEYYSAAGNTKLKQLYKNLVLDLFEKNIKILKPSRLFDEVHKLHKERKEFLERKEKEHLELCKRKEKESLELCEKVMDLQQQTETCFPSGFLDYHFEFFSGKGKMKGYDSPQAKFILKRHEELISKEEENLQYEKPAEMEPDDSSDESDKDHPQKKLKPAEVGLDSSDESDKDRPQKKVKHAEIISDDSSDESDKDCTQKKLELETPVSGGDGGHGRGRGGPGGDGGHGRGRGGPGAHGGHGRGRGGPGAHGGHGRRRGGPGADGGHGHGRADNSQRQTTATSFTGNVWCGKRTTFFGDSAFTGNAWSGKKKTFDDDE